MRPLKFRVWDDDRKHYTIIDLRDFIRLNEPAQDEALPPLCDYNSLEQFTGLHDRAGVEIYEGDLVRLTGTYTVDFMNLKNNPVCEVRYVECTWMLCDKENDVGTSLESFSTSIEVIGNIHQK